MIREEPYIITPVEDIGVLFETEDPYLLSIFQEEIRKAQLDGLDIRLLVPDNPETCDKLVPRLHGRAIGYGDLEYSVELYPMAIERFNSTPRKTMRHELAHIKYGDLGRKLPKLIEKLYSIFVKEPRANWYAAQD